MKYNTDLLLNTLSETFAKLDELSTREERVDEILFKEKQAALWAIKELEKKIEEY